MPATVDIHCVYQVLESPEFTIQEHAR